MIQQLVAPSEFSLRDNHDGVMKCVWAIRKKALSKDHGSVYVDLNQIEKISPAAALLLTAELDRWRRVRKLKLRPRDIPTMAPQVLITLREMGFFKVLQTDTPPLDDLPPNEVKVIEFKCGNKSDLRTASDLSEALQGVAGKSLGDTALQLNDAVAEAMTNSVQHAYPKKTAHGFPVIEGAWWATGSYDPVVGVLKVWIYDQGVGIPKSLPSSGVYEQVRQRLASMPRFGNHISDHALLIQAAVEEGRTSTLRSGRGLGLAEMRDLVEARPGSHLRILSGRGEVIFEPGQPILRTNHRRSLGGTLVEISLSVF